MANQTRQLARLLSESGLHVELVQVNPAYVPKWIGRVRGVRAIFRLLPYLMRLWRCAGRVDVLHVMANSGWAWHLVAAPAVWIAYLRGKPAIVNYRGGEAEAFLERQVRLVRPTLTKADAIVVPSAFLQGVFGRWNVKTVIVPNIVDLTRFHPGVRETKRLHLIVARNLEPIYDVATAIRAFAIVRVHFPQAQLSIAGSGPLLSVLERLCADIGVSDSVTFTGGLDSDNMAELYREADVLLNPSLVDNMPNALLEALASGVPIVSTNVGGIPYLVEHEKTALLVPAGDTAAMAAAALRVIGNRQLAMQLGEAGQEAAQRYAWPNVRGALFDVYAHAVGRAPLCACKT